ncbi:hypothetical protein KQI84_18805 [bacterium]|nr:hypothetical protein [bacterium]
MRRIIPVAFVLLGLLVNITGCGSSNKYRVMETRSEYPEIPMKVVVTPLEDARPFDRDPAILYWIPLLPWATYKFSRHDEVYPGSVEAFNQLFSRDLAQRLKEAEVFSQVEYTPIEELPPLGSYDLLITGTLEETTSRGGVSYYGLSIFGDLVWFLGLPKFTRIWDLKADIQVFDGYTGDPITDPILVQETTSRRFFTRYAKEGSTKDLMEKITPIWDQFIVELRAEVPPAGDNYWAQLRKDGEAHVAKLAREAELARKGSPPTFSFLYPAAGDIVREPTTTIRWSATAPGGTKSIALVVNNQAIDLGINPLDLLQEDKSPRNFSARDLAIPLHLGKNTLEAMVVDHRGNETRANFEIQRMPKQLSPTDRFALLIGVGSSEATRTVNELASVFADPLIGQFDSEDVQVVAENSLDSAALGSAINSFGKKPLANQLAFVYVAASGNADGLTIGSGGNTMSIDDLMSTIERAMATEEIVVILDIDWSGPKREYIDDLSNLPKRWAVIASAEETVPATKSSGGFLFGMAMASVMKDGLPGRETLTLENVMDAVMDEVESLSDGEMVPVMEGRYRPGITMVERE